jgi:hypothetical protein
MPSVYDVAQNQVLAKPVSSFYEGKAIRAGLRAQELQSKALEQDIELAPEKLAIEQQKAQNAFDKNTIDLRKLEKEIGKEATEYFIDAYASGLEAFEESGDPQAAYDVTASKLATIDPNLDPAEAKAKLDEATGGVFDPESVKALLMTADEYRQRGRASSFVNFRNPETEDETSVRTDSPEADELAEQGWTRVGVTQKTLQSDDPGDIFGGSGDKITDRNTREVVGSAENMLSAIDRIKQKVDEMPQASMGLPGATARLIDNAASSVMGFADLFGGIAMIGDQEVQESFLLDTRLYQDMFVGPAVESAGLQSMQVGLAYALARSANPDGRISDQDVRSQMERVRLGGSSKPQIQAAIFEVEREVLSNTANHLRINEYTRNAEGKKAFDEIMTKLDTLESDRASAIKDQDIPIISSDEEWEALPKGAIFYAPDGTRRQK